MNDNLVYGALTGLLLVGLFAKLIQSAEKRQHTTAARPMRTAKRRLFLVTGAKQA